MANKPAELDHGGKILLPQSALITLTQLQIDYPMLFEVTSSVTGLKTHCGVQEFTAEEGRCYMPFWMMQSLGMSEGSMVSVSSTSLPNGDFVKLQPHKTEFIELSNPKAVLEKQLSTFSTLTKGETIAIHYNNKVYYIDVVEIQPDTLKHAVSIVETNIQVDFAEPLDHATVQAERSAASAPPSDVGTAEAAPEATGGAAEPHPEQLRFSGTGRSLNGKESVYSPPAPSSDAAAPAPQSPAKEDIMFGTRYNKTKEVLERTVKDDRFVGRRKRSKAKQEEEKKNQEQKAGYKPFAGTGYSLKG